MLLIAVGKLRPGPERALFERYNARLRPGLAVREVAEAPGPPNEVKRREAAAMLAALPDPALAVALDPGGAAPDSETLVALLERWRAANRLLAFLIGGAEGARRGRAQPGGRAAFAGRADLAALPGARAARRATLPGPVHRGRPPLSSRPRSSQPRPSQPMTPVRQAGHHQMLFCYSTLYAQLIKVKLRSKGRWMQRLRRLSCGSSRPSGKLSSAEQRMIGSIPLQFRDVASNQDLVREGDRPTQCILLVDGFAARHRTLSDGAPADPVVSHLGRLHGPAELYPRPARPQYRHAVGLAGRLHPA